MTEVGGKAPKLELLILFVSPEKEFSREPITITSMTCLLKYFIKKMLKVFKTLKKPLTFLIITTMFAMTVHYLHCFSRTTSGIFPPFSNNYLISTLHNFYTSKYINKWHWLVIINWVNFGFKACINSLYIHLLKKGCLLNCCIVHCALLHTQTAKYHGCNKFVHCCMPRPQSILFHIASMANTRMSLFHNRYLQCYLKIRYIHGALRSGYATIRNAQCNNSEDNHFF